MQNNDKYYIQAIPTEHGLDILSGELKNTATQYVLIGAPSHDALPNEWSEFHRDTIYSSYFDENGVLTFIIDMPIEEDFGLYLHRISILDAQGKSVIEVDTPKVSLAKNIGGLFTIKATVTGEAGEVIFKTSEFITELEMEQLWLPPIYERICPVGIPFPWPTDTAPDGWAIMKGQAFDTQAYQELAKVYPTGILPDMRGLAIVGKADDETILAFEEGQIKAHSHGASVHSTNLGTKYTNTTGNHYHATNTPTEWSLNSTYGTGKASNEGKNRLGRHASTSSAGNHKHTVAIGSHSHGVTISSTGQSKNTVDHRKFNWIVRLA